MNTNHETFRLQIQDWLSGQLAAEAADQFMTHMAECPDCATLAESEKELWEMLGQGDVRASGPVPSVWPTVRERTFGSGQSSAWFFGGRQLVRASLAACAVVTGLMVGVLVPGLSATATADEGSGDLWVSEASWLDDSATDGLAGIWLDPGLEDEGDGS